MILLSKEERDKFALYLDEQAKSDLLMAKQMESAPFLNPAMSRSFTQKYRTEAMAKQIVSKLLKEIVDFDAGKSGEGNDDQNSQV